MRYHHHPIGDIMLGTVSLAIGLTFGSFFGAHVDHPLPGPKPEEPVLVVLDDGTIVLPADWDPGEGDPSDPGHPVHVWEGVEVQCALAAGFYLFDTDWRNGRLVVDLDVWAEGNVWGPMLVDMAYCLGVDVPGIIYEDGSFLDAAGRSACLPLNYCTNHGHGLGRFRIFI